MFELVITLVPSLCWIFYRCLQILQTPVEVLVTDMQIEIPHTPRVCIDSITTNSVILHWDIEVRSHENLYYVLVINNHEVATLVSTSCKLNNLSVSQLYEIQIIAINSMSNFKSQSVPVYIEPMGDVDFEEKFYEEERYTGEMESEIHKPEKEDIVHQNDSKDISPKDLKVHSKHTQRHSKDQNLAIDSITTSDVPLLSEVDLNNLLIYFQNEIIKVTMEYKTYNQQSTKELAKLTETYNQYKKEFNEEHDNKQRKETSVKILENSKNELNYEKSKLSNHLQKLQQDIGIYHAKIAGLEGKIRALTKRNKASFSSELEEKDELEKQIIYIKHEIERMKGENERAEENVKLLVLERKKLGAVVKDLKQAVEAFTVSSSAKSGTSNEVTNHATNSTALLNRQLHVLAWEEELKDLQHYVALEAKWRETYKSAIQKYVSVHNTVEMSKSEIDPSYQPVKLSEYQASIDFGGFSNAISKKRHKEKSRSNKSEDYRNEENYYNHYSQVYTEEGVDQINTQTISLDSKQAQQSSVHQQHSLDPPSYEQTFGTSFEQPQNNNYQQLPVDNTFQSYDNYEQPKSSVPASLAAQLPSQMANHFSQYSLRGLPDMNDSYNGYNEPQTQSQPLLNYSDMGSLFYNSPSFAHVPLNSSVQNIGAQSNLGSMGNLSNLQGSLQNNLQGSNLQSNVNVQGNLQSAPGNLQNGNFNNSLNTLNNGFWSTNGLFPSQSVSSLQAESALQSTTNLQSNLQGIPMMQNLSSMSNISNVNLNPSTQMPGSPSLSPTPSVLSTLSPGQGNLQINSSMLGSYKHAHTTSRGYNLWVDNGISNSNSINGTNINNLSHSASADLDLSAPFNSQLWRSDSFKSNQAFAGNIGRSASPNPGADAVNGSGGKTDFQPFSSDINLRDSHLY